ncbi:MAG: hypothetical protein IKE94_01220 [Aeriscardovia sp.]|nr:hypothetical protein [Aeriscardovia sp.]
MYNASQTKSPIVNDLSISPFVSEIMGYGFHFSSERHMRKFDDEKRKRMSWLTDSMSRRFHMHVNSHLLSLFQLYMQIEGRGFYVERFMTGEVYRTPDDICFEVVMMDGRTDIME